VSPRAPFRNRSVVLFMLVNESIRRGWSYQTMAEAAGVERNTVTSWCRGDRTPNVFNMELWAKKLGGYLMFVASEEAGDAPSRSS